MYNFSIEAGQNFEIDFFTKISNKKPNYSVLIGKNGTYKSEIISSIASEISPRRKKGFIRFVPSSKIGNKIIAISLSPFCKFPTSKSISKSLKEDYVRGTTTEHDLIYNYIGIKTNKSFLAFGRSNIYEVLLKALIAGKDNGKLQHIKHVFEVLKLNKEVIFAVKFKVPVHDITEIIKSKKFSKIDHEVLNKLIQNDLYKNMFDGSTINRTGYTFQVDFRKDKEVGSFYLELLLGLELLKKSNLASIEKVTISSTDYTKIFDLSVLSSGESSFFYTFLGLISSIENNSLILIDEPELSLHPNLQIDFLKHFDEIISQYEGIKVIIATHSPHILSGLPLSRSVVTALKKENSLITFRNISQELYGWSVEDILFDVFQIKTSRNLSINEAACTIAEMIAEVKEFNKEVYDRHLSKLKALELPFEDPLNVLISEADKYREAK